MVRVTGADEPITVDGQRTTLRALVAACKATVEFTGVGPVMTPDDYYVIVHVRPGVGYTISKADFDSLGGHPLAGRGR